MLPGKHATCHARATVVAGCAVMLRVGLALALSVGCSPPSRHAVEAGRPASTRGATANPSQSLAAPSVSAVQAPSSAPVPSNARAPSSAPPSALTFERLETSTVLSFALGRPPKVAALTHGEVLVFDGKKTVRIPAPDTRQPELSVELFFGRDDQPRLMGFVRPTSGKTRAYYRRYRGGSFQPEPSELGPLAAEGILYGVLGHDDPEVVCGPGRFCLVKRVSGWGRAPAHAEPKRILLGAGTAYALGADRIERLERDAWVPLVPERAFENPVSLAVDPTGALWVVEAKRDVVSHLVDERWETIASPVRGARAVLANAANDVWLAGSAGVAHFDGATWRGIPGVPGPLSFVARSGSTLWLSGEAGVFRCSLARSE